MSLSPSKHWVRLTLFLLIGYTTFTRAFAYLGVPAAKVFIGELALAVFLVIQGPAVLEALMSAMTRSSIFSKFSWTAVLFVFYGIGQVLRGMYLGYSPLTTLEELVFNVYLLYFFLGLWAGLNSPDVLRRFIRIISWWNVIYVLAYFIYLNKLSWTIPGTNVEVFRASGAGVLVVLGLLCFEQQLGWHWIPFGINAFMILALEIRALWVALFVSCIAWTFLSGGYRRAGIVVSSLIALLTIGYMVDFNIPAPAERGGAISTSVIIARAIASADPEVAREYDRNAYLYTGDVNWRTRWWTQIWNSVNRDLSTMLFGNGYGFPLSGLVPYLRRMDIRTPHNVFFYALGYSGWVGVVLFFGVQFAVASLMYRVFRATGQAFGLLLWIIAITGAFFGNSFETPFGAIPIYLLLGLSAAPLCKLQGAERGYSCHPQLVPAARW